MPERLPFEQLGLRQAVPGPTPFDSLQHTTAQLQDIPLVGPGEPRPYVEEGKYPSGVYRLLKGLGLVPSARGHGYIPDGYYVVGLPFMVSLPRPYTLNDKRGPEVVPVTDGTISFPSAAEEPHRGDLRIIGNAEYGTFYIDPAMMSKRPHLVVPQFKLPSHDTVQAKRIFDMSPKRSQPAPDTKLAAVAQPKENSPDTPQARLLLTRPPRRPQGSKPKTPPSRQRSFEFSIPTSATTVSAHLVTVPQTPELASLPVVSKPKAGDTGQVPLGKRAAKIDFQDHLDFRGARKEVGFWELPHHVKKFWDTVVDGKKPFKKIPVKDGLVYFVPKNKQILGVRGYPKGVGVDEYPDLDVFDRGGVLANQTCFIPSAGSSHEGIVYPVNGSCKICVVVPNHAGEYDYSDGKNRGPIPAGSIVVRPEDKLLCEFDPIDDPNTRYATYHLFAPVSSRGGHTANQRGVSTANLSPQEAQKQFMNHYYREEARKHGKQERLKRAGTLFSTRI